MINIANATQSSVTFTISGTNINITRSISDISWLSSKLPNIILPPNNNLEYFFECLCRRYDVIQVLNKISNNQNGGRHITVDGTIDNDNFDSNILEFWFSNEVLDISEYVPTKTAIRDTSYGTNDITDTDTINGTITSNISIEDFTKTQKQTKIKTKNLQKSLNNLQKSYKNLSSSLFELSNKISSFSDFEKTKTEKEDNTSGINVDYTSTLDNFSVTLETTARHADIHSTSFPDPSIFLSWIDCAEKIIDYEKTIKSSYDQAKQKTKKKEKEIEKFKNSNKFTKISSLVSELRTFKVEEESLAYKLGKFNEKLDKEVEYYNNEILKLYLKVFREYAGNEVGFSEKITRSVSDKGERIRSGVSNSERRSGIRDAEVI